MENTIKKAIEAAQERRFNDKVKSIKGKKVLLYGAGGFGAEMSCQLRNAGVCVSAFLDQRAVELKSVGDVPVYTAEQAPFDRAESVVLLCIVMDILERGELTARLRELGYRTIIEAQSLRCLLVQPDDLLPEESAAEYYTRRLTDIFKASELFGDALSREVYLNHVYSHITGDYSRCTKYERPMGEQYFPSDVPLKKGYGRFIDCGGYIGDTAEHLVGHFGHIEAYAAFEPDSGNFRRLAKYLGSVRKAIGERILFPCAVSGGTSVCHFERGTGSGMLNDSGTAVVQTVSLDEAVPDFRPTYIKMDIEGSEPDALSGAERLISKHRPELAVCVYHSVNHIWDIPLKLSSWEQGYSFYLRSYNAFTMETVLYATAAGR